MNNVVREIIPSVKYRAYGVASYDSQNQYFAYVAIWELIAQKIPHNKGAAAVRSVIASDSASKAAVT